MQKLMTSDLTQDQYYYYNWMNTVVKYLFYPLQKWFQPILITFTMTI